MSRNHIWGDRNVLVHAGDTEMVNVFHSVCFISGNRTCYSYLPPPPPLTLLCQPHNVMCNHQRAVWNPRGQSSGTFQPSPLVPSFCLTLIPSLLPQSDFAFCDMKEVKSTDQEQEFLCLDELPTLVQSHAEYVTM